MKNVLIVAAISIIIVGVGIFVVIGNRPKSPNTNNATVEQSDDTTARKLSPEILAVIEKKLTLLETLTSDSTLVTAVQESSGKNAQLTSSQIKELDAKWSQDDTFVQLFLANDVATKLTEFQEENPEFPEIFVTDKVGLNVGQTNKTSDYYQADEKWWQDAYANGTGKVAYGEIEFDESAKSESIALSLPIYSPSRDIVGVMKAVLSLSGIKREL